MIPIIQSFLDQHLANNPKGIMSEHLSLQVYQDQNSVTYKSREYQPDFCETKVKQELVHWKELSPIHSCFTLDKYKAQSLSSNMVLSYHNIASNIVEIIIQNVIQNLSIKSEIIDDNKAGSYPKAIIQKIDKPIQYNIRNLERLVDKLSEAIRKLDTGYTQTVSLYCSYPSEPILWPWIGNFDVKQTEIVTNKYYISSKKLKTTVLFPSLFSSELSPELALVASQFSAKTQKLTSVTSDFSSASVSDPELDLTLPLVRGDWDGVPSPLFASHLMSPSRRGVKIVRANPNALRPSSSHFSHRLTNNGQSLSEKKSQNDTVKKHPLPIISSPYSIESNTSFELNEIKTESLSPKNSISNLSGATDIIQQKHRSDADFDNNILKIYSPNIVNSSSSLTIAEVVRTNPQIISFDNSHFNNDISRSDDSKSNYLGNSLKNKEKLNRDKEKLKTDNAIKWDKNLLSTMNSKKKFLQLENNIHFQNEYRIDDESKQLKFHTKIISKKSQILKAKPQESSDKNLYLDTIVSDKLIKKSNNKINSLGSIMTRFKVKDDYIVTNMHNVTQEYINPYDLIYPE